MERTVDSLLKILQSDKLDMFSNIVLNTYLHKLKDGLEPKLEFDTYYVMTKLGYIDVDGKLDTSENIEKDLDILLEASDKYFDLFHRKLLIDGWYRCVRNEFKPEGDFTYTYECVWNGEQFIDTKNANKYPTKYFDEITEIKVVRLKIKDLAEWCAKGYGYYVYEDRELNFEGDCRTEYKFNRGERNDEVPAGIKVCKFSDDELHEPDNRYIDKI